MSIFKKLCKVRHSHKVFFFIPQFLLYNIKKYAKMQLCASCKDVARDNASFVPAAPR